MSTEMPAYGLWGLVIVNSVIFILFAYTFFKPQTARDWRSFGAFSAFLVALFTEMYGFPLTIYFLSGWLQSRYPGVDWFSHDAGHLTEMMFGWKANPHFGPFHILSFVLIGGGFWSTVHPEIAPPVRKGPDNPARQGQLKASHTERSGKPNRHVRYHLRRESSDQDVHLRRDAGPCVARTGP